jgi:predicted alpha/beta superfamily hydrolase
MLRIFPGLLTLLIVTLAAGQNIVHFKIKSLPAYHPSGSDIYAAGSFNGWNPQDTSFKFKHDKNGSYSLDLRLETGSYEFKITRGGWDHVECGKHGESIGNRFLKIVEKTTVDLAIEEWADRFPAVSKKSTASRNVQIIDTAFLIPQLKRTRKIWVYLPENYATGTERFPVIYMQDGQNIFDNATAYSGEWGIDEYFDSLERDIKKCMVVAIDNGGTKRLNEYCPYNFKLAGVAAGSRSNKGEGNAYVDFLVKTLKPYIDRNYRTEADKENTFIAGSSLGALISLYAVLKYPAVFGAAAVFSPAFWIAPKIFDDIKTKGKKLSSKIYFFAGKLESETIVTGTRKAHGELKKISRSTIKMVISEEGRHNEGTWRNEFPLFYRWIVDK